MKKLTIIALIIVLVVAIYVVFFSETENNLEIFDIASPNEPKQAVNTVINIELEEASTKLVPYAIPVSDLSFEYPTNWRCQSLAVDINNPSWRQTTCVNKNKEVTNPLVVINTPHFQSSEDSSLLKVLNVLEEELIVVNNIRITKKVYQGKRASDYMVVEYTSGNVDETNSFILSLPFRLDEGTTLSDTEAIGGKILDSITIAG